MLKFTVPEVTWEEREVTIPEGDDMMLCFNSNIGSAVEYEIIVAASGKGSNPAVGELVTLNNRRCHYPSTCILLYRRRLFNWVSSHLQRPSQRIWRTLLCGC